MNDDEITPIRKEPKSINPLLDGQDHQKHTQVHPLNYSEPDQEEIKKEHKKDRRHSIKEQAKSIQKNAMDFILTGGQKSSESRYKKMMKNSQMSQAKMKDEEFKKNHKVAYVQLVIWFYFQYIVMPVFILFGTIMCIITLVLWNYYDCGRLGEAQSTLVVLDMMVGVSFILELVYNLGSNISSVEDVVVQVLDAENVMDALLIFHMFWVASGMPRHKVLAVFNILRALRVTKLRYMTKLVSHYFKNFLLEGGDDLEAQEQGQDFDEEGQLNTFIVDSLIKFTSSILIQSTYFLVFDELVDHEGFVPYAGSGTRMEFLQASYFVVVSFSTIGYGDIYPVHSLTRFSCLLALIVNITVMSNFLGKMVEFLFQLSAYDTAYDFQDHVVIIGQLPDDQLKDFLDELVQVDIAYRSLINNSTRIKTIIVSDNEPSEFMVDMAFFYTEEYENEVTFLKEAIFTQNKKWCVQSNLKKARILFAFSWANDDGLSYENDQIISLVARGAKEAYPHLHILAILNSTFKDQFEKDSLYDGIQVLAPYQLNDFILASSLQNTGMSTILQHLITMKAKQVPDPVEEIVNQENFLQSYMQFMQQEVYQFAIPDFYIGMSFKNYAQLLYLYGLVLGDVEINENQYFQDHIRDDRKMTLIAVETKSLMITNEINDYSQLRPEPAFQTSNNVNQSSVSKFQDEEEGFLSNATTTKRSRRLPEGGQQESQVLINPQEYIIKKGDIGYVICEDYETVKEALSIVSKDDVRYLNYLSNAQRLEQRVTRDNTMDHISDLYLELHDRYRKYEDCSEWLGEDKVFSEVFDLIDDENYPTFKFKGHVIVFGNIISFQNVVRIIRQYSDKPMVLYNSQPVDPFKWNDIKTTTSNIFYIRGDFLNLDHLKLLRIKEAENILILSDLLSLSFSDAIGLSLARIILDHYDRSDFMLELKDSTKITLLNNNPKLKHVHCPSFLQPSFAAGNVHFTSMITAILAKVVYTTNWISFFKDLIIPDSQAKFKQNKTIHQIQISQDLADLRFFGQLQYALLQGTPSIIAFGLVKKTFGSQYKESMIDQFQSEEFLKMMEKLIQVEENEEQNQTQVRKRKRGGQQQNKSEKSKKKIQKQTVGILSKILGDKIVLTNPSFYTIIEKGDCALVIGDMMEKREGVDKLSSADSGSSSKIEKAKIAKHIQKMKHIQAYEEVETRQEMKDELIKVLKKKYEILEKLEKNNQEQLQDYK